MQRKLHTKISGRYKLRALKLDDNGNEMSARETPWFSNLITNGGLNRMADNSDYLEHCQVGSGSNAPAVTDTALQSKLADTSSMFDSEDGNTSSSPYFCWRRNTYRFSAGTATGNVSEVGVGRSATGNLFSRALVLDGGGSPTTITVLADETLDVVYELRFDVPETDFVSDSAGLTFTGSIGGTYDWIIRAANCTDSGTDSNGWHVDDEGSGMNRVPAGALDVRSGDIGPITGGPSGNTGSDPSFSSESYVNDSFELAYTMSFGLGQGNVDGGLRSVVFKAGIGEWQIQFDPAIPKTDEDLLNLSFLQSWGRV